MYEECNILRGPIDQDDYKSYVIPLLFYKRVSDVYDEETADNELQYGEDIIFYPEEELHTFIIPKGCHWKDVRNTSEDVGKAIVDAMMGIEHANPDTMAGLFSSFDDANWTDKTKLDDERLKDLIEHVSALPVGNRNYSADVMGDAYEGRPKMKSSIFSAVKLPNYEPEEIKALSAEVRMAIDGVVGAGVGGLAGLAAFGAGAGALVAVPAMAGIGVVLCVKGFGLMNKAIKNRRQAKQMAENVDKIVAFYADLRKAADSFRGSVSAVYRKYAEGLQYVENTLSTKSV